VKTLTIRMPDDKANRLKALAQRRNVSVNKLIEELSTIALTEYDAQVSYEMGPNYNPVASAFLASLAGHRSFGFACFCRLL
jgi:hypothetical protein